MFPRQVICAALGSAWSGRWEMWRGFWLIYALSTLLYERMTIVNSRTLTTTQLTHYSTVEPRPLSSNMILTMKNDWATAAPGVFTEPIISTCKRWRRIQYLAEQLNKLKMALVSEVYPSKDHLVRKVCLHLGKGRYLDSSRHKLVLLIPSPQIRFRKLDLGVTNNFSITHAQNAVTSCYESLFCSRITIVKQDS